MGGLYNLQTFFGVYNFIVNTSKQVLFLPPSDAYVRSFLYLLYTLIKLYYTKALSDQASSLAPDWILLLRGPRIPVYSRESTTTFHCQSIELTSRRDMVWIQTIFPEYLLKKKKRKTWNHKTNTSFISKLFFMCVCVCFSILSMFNVLRCFWKNNIF